MNPVLDKAKITLVRLSNVYLDIAIYYRQIARNIENMNAEKLLEIIDDANEITTQEVKIREKIKRRKKKRKQTKKAKVVFS